VNAVKAMRMEISNWLVHNGYRKTATLNLTYSDNDTKQNTQNSIHTKTKKFIYNNKVLLQQNTEKTLANVWFDVLHRNKRLFMSYD